MFTGVIQDHYGAPHGFNFATDEQIVDDVRLKNYNVCRKVKEFVSVCKERGKWQKGKHIFLPMGDDFAYDNAAVWFKNMDKLMVRHSLVVVVLLLLTTALALCYLACSVNATAFVLTSHSTT